MNMRRVTKVRTRGFTLLELIVVMSMMAILAAISLGKTSRILSGWRVNRAAQALSEELQQGYAIVGRTRKPVIFEFNRDSMALFIKSRSNEVYRRRYVGLSTEYKLRAADVTLSRKTLEVYPPGLAADSLSIVISQPGTARRIRMLRGGLVQVCPTGATNKC